MLTDLHKTMDLHKMIVELQAERERLDAAIEALERLSTSTVRRRGRPPRWLKDLGNPPEGLDPAEQDGAGKNKPS